MPNVTPHLGTGVFSIESYEASNSRNEKARFKHAAGQVVETRKTTSTGSKPAEAWEG